VAPVPVRFPNHFEGGPGPSLLGTGEVSNMTNDGFHSYTYDAEGNITAVDNGTTATYVYNAQNQRVSVTVGSTITEYVFSAAGQRVSEWNGTTRAQIKGKYYWGGKPVAYYAGGAAHFEHQDWLPSHGRRPVRGDPGLGTERILFGRGVSSATGAVKPRGRAEKF